MSAPQLQVQTSDGIIHDLLGAADLQQELEKAPVRYVLDDAASQMIANAAYSENNIVATSLDLLRFPSDVMWLEWSTAGTDRAINALHFRDHQNPRANYRVGALVTCDPSGRRGRINIAWQDEEGNCDVSPILIEFDLDNSEFCDAPNEVLSTRKMFVRGLESLDGLLGYSRYCMESSWHDYYKEYAPRNAAMREQLYSSCFTTVAGDFPFVTAFLTILSARGSVERSDVRQQKLNKNRARKGRPPLLDHTAVSLALDATEDFGGAFSGASDGVRLHHVCGHLVRRQDKLFWRRAHLRGNPQKGVITHRNVSVLGCREKRAA